MKPSRILALGLGVAMGLAALPRAASAEQPDKWVRYVESAGSSWVDTGIIGRWNTRIEAKVEWMNLADSAFVACGYYSNNTRFYMCYCLNGNGEVNLAQRVNATVTLKSGWNTRFEKNRVYNYSAAFSATNSAGISTGTVAIDGVSGWSKDFTGLNTGRSLYVFANNSADGTVGGKSKSRCYGLKIYQGSENGGSMVLVRNFQPCMKGGRAGLYDAVSETIFYSITSTDLVCDENSEVPDEYIDYVESTGDAAFDNDNKQYPSYIDTGIIGRSGTKVVGEFAILQDEDGGLVGSRSGSTRCYMLHDYHGRVACGHGTFKDNSSSCDYGKRYWFETIFEDGSQSLSRGADGVTNTIWSGTEGTIDTGLPLYIFTCNVDGKPNLNNTSSMSAKARCYGLEIWQDNVMVRQFKPCLKNGVAGLYDTVSGRIFYSSGTPLSYNNVYRESVKPKEVIFVEYIESDGYNTLDTGVPAQTGIRAKGKMAWLHEDENGTGQLRTWDRESSRYLEETAAVFWRQKRAYLGARNIKNNSKWFHLIHESSSTLKAQYGGSGELSAKSGGANVALYVGTNYTFDVTFADGTQTMEWNGVQVLNETTAGSVDSGDTLHLFSSSHWRWRSEARCYGLEIYQNGTLVRNFRPCICQTADGVYKGMLYDTVTESIYRPSPDIPLSRVGNIVLTGEEKPMCYVDYVETNGKQFIDTGVIGKAATTAEIKETCLQVSTSEECFLGSYGGASDSVSRFYIWYHAWGSTAGIGYGEYWRPKNNDPYTPAANSSDPDVYKQNVGDTTHARISFAVGSQTFSTIDDATGTETLYSSRTLSDNVDTGRTMYLFAKNDNNAGNPISPAGSRFYFLKIWQGNSDGTEMQLVRNLKPMKLSNGLVVLWDSVEKKAYPAQSTTSPYNYTFFPVVGPDGDKIAEAFMMIVR